MDAAVILFPLRLAGHAVGLPLNHSCFPIEVLIPVVGIRVASRISCTRAPRVGSVGTDRAIGTVVRPPSSMTLEVVYMFGYDVYITAHPSARPPVTVPANACYHFLPKSRCCLDRMDAAVGYLLLLRLRSDVGDGSPLRRRISLPVPL